MGRVLVKKTEPWIGRHELPRSRDKECAITPRRDVAGPCPWAGRVRNDSRKRGDHPPRIHETGRLSLCPCWFVLGAMRFDGGFSLW